MNVSEKRIEKASASHLRIRALCPGPLSAGIFRRRGRTMGSSEVRARQRQARRRLRSNRNCIHTSSFSSYGDDDGEAHALQPRELYKTQQYATAVYRSELAHRLKNLGYENRSAGRAASRKLKGLQRENTLQRSVVDQHDRRMCSTLPATYLEVQLLSGSDYLLPLSWSHILIYKNIPRSALISFLRDVPRVSLSGRYLDSTLQVILRC